MRLRKRNITFVAFVNTKARRPLECTDIDVTLLFRTSRKQHQLTNYFSLYDGHALMKKQMFAFDLQ